VTEETPKDLNVKSEDDQGQDPLEQLQEALKDAIRQKSESEKKAAEYLSRLQRLQADMENVQKMTKRQVETVTLHATERLLLKLLPSLDALREAVKIAGSNDALPQDEIAVGLKMLQEQMYRVLETEGLEEIRAVGKPLDPAFHEVVSYVETEDVPENKVMEEVRKGYTLNGKVLRPSLVVVSKKPKTDEPSSAESE